MKCKLQVRYATVALDAAWGQVYPSGVRALVHGGGYLLGATCSGVNFMGMSCNGTKSTGADCTEATFTDAARARCIRCIYTSCSVDSFDVDL